MNNNNNKGQTISFDRKMFEAKITATVKVTLCLHLRYSQPKCA